MKKKRMLFNTDEFFQKFVQAYSQDLDRMPRKQLYASNGKPLDLKSMLMKGVVKKYVDKNTKTSVLHDVAVEQFIENCYVIDMRYYSRIFDDSTVLTKIVPKVRSIIDGILGHFSVEEWFEQCQNSSGASLGVPYSDTSIEAKFTYPITGTADAIELFDQYLEWDMELSKAIEDVNRLSPHPKYRVVEGSRFDTVPKTAQKNRNIAVEPTINMFFQQGLMHLIVSRLRRAGLDLETLPPRHKDYALEGSILQSIATLDLKGASDSIHKELIRLFSYNWRGALNKVRSPVCEVAGRNITLPLFATMGNATTFPVQTLLFYAISCAAIDLKLGLYPNSQLVALEARKDVSVFGDDIIVPDIMANAVIEALHLFGFEVNTEKSFWGNDIMFRESCGGDFYYYHDVRPFSPERPSQETQNGLRAWLFSLWNRVCKIYIQYIGPNYVYENRTLRLIAHHLNLLGPTYVVPKGYPETAGLVDPDLRLLRHYKLHLSPIVIDKNGSEALFMLEFEYVQQWKALTLPNELLRLHSFLKLSHTRKPRWITKRKNGRWNRVFTLSFTTCFTRGAALIPGWYLEGEECSEVTLVSIYKTLKKS